MKASIIAALVAASMVCGASAAQKNYLRFTARGGTAEIGMVDYYAGKANSTPPLTLEWTDDPDAALWSLFEAGSTTLTLADGETAYLRQHDPERKAVTRPGSTLGWSFTMSNVTESATVEAGGNCLSIIDATCGCDAVVTNALSYLFWNCAILTTPPELPARRLARDSYYSMFYGCSSLTRPPELPALELGESCYNSMFKKCTSLAVAPALPAMKLERTCYCGMFDGCTSLESAPHLPATELPDNCYNDMFSGCLKLRRISVAFTTWQTSYLQTIYWLRKTAESGLFICPASLAKTYGDGYIPSGWTVAEPVTVKVPRQANCTAVATADGAAITGTPDGDAAVFVFGKGKEDADIAFEPSEGYALVGAAEYTIPKIAAPVTFGTGDYALPTVVRLAPEVSYQSAALQFDGLAVEEGAVSFSFGVRTTAALDLPDWQPATVTGAAVSPDGKTVTLTIPATAAQGFYRLAEK